MFLKKKKKEDMYLAKQKENKRKKFLKVTPKKELYFILMPVLVTRITVCEFGRFLRIKWLILTKCCTLCFHIVDQVQTETIKVRLLILHCFFFHVSFLVTFFACVIFKNYIPEEIILTIFILLFDFYINIQVPLVYQSLINFFTVKSQFTTTNHYPTQKYWLQLFLRLDNVLRNLTIFVTFHLKKRWE